MNLDAIRKRFGELEDAFEALYERTIDEIPIQNKKLKDALSNQIDLQLEWGMLAKSVGYIYDMCEIASEGEYSGAMTKELKDSYKTTTISEAREFAKASAHYQETRKLLAEIRRLKGNVNEVCETVNSRKYVLNNITNAVVASVENHII